MDSQSLAPALGIVACLAAVASVAAPYLFVPDVAAVSEYYALGAVTPLTIGLFALVGVVAFAAGLKRRSDPSLVAGLMLVAGVVSLLIALSFAFSFGGLRGDLVSADTRDLLSAHRWTILLAAALWSVAAGWYTWALGLVSPGR